MRHSAAIKESILSVAGVITGSLNTASFSRLSNRDTLKLQHSPAPNSNKPSEKTKNTTITNGTEDTRDPKTRALEQQKERARLILDRLIEELKLVKKVWAHDPKGMAKQIGRITQQLKEALELYQSAHEALKGGSNTIAGLPSGISSATSLPSSTSAANAQTSQNSYENDEHQAETSAAQEAPNSEFDNDPDVMDTEDNMTADISAQAQSAYEKPQLEFYRLDRTDEALALKSDFEFVGFVRDLKTKLKETLDYMKQKAIVQLPKGAENSEEFVDAEKEIEELEEELKDFEKDLKKQSPPAVMVSRFV
jgi:hypothetical protein